MCLRRATSACLQRATSSVGGLGRAREVQRAIVDRLAAHCCIDFGAWRGGHGGGGGGGGGGGAGRV
eukprot:5497227-Prymnesium_polylepis.1